MGGDARTVVRMLARHETKRVDAGDRVGWQTRQLIGVRRGSMGWWVPGARAGSPPDLPSRRSRRRLARQGLETFKSTNSVWATVNHPWLWNSFGPTLRVRGRSDQGRADTAVITLSFVIWVLLVGVYMVGSIGAIVAGAFGFDRGGSELLWANVKGPLAVGLLLIPALVVSGWILAWGDVAKLRRALEEVAGCEDALA